MKFIRWYLKLFFSNLAVLILVAWIFAALVGIGPLYVIAVGVVIFSVYFVYAGGIRFPKNFAVHWGRSLVTRFLVCSFAAALFIRIFGAQKWSVLCGGLLLFLGLSNWHDRWTKIVQESLESAKSVGVNPSEVRLHSSLAYAMMTGTVIALTIYLGLRVIGLLLMRTPTI